jgi:alkylation response protein AidB-like acyl-CoA dehydrogenase
VTGGAAADPPFDASQGMLHELLRGVAGELSLPLPGHGDTARRHDILMQWGRRDLSLARIAEAHTDAIAILAEGGQQPRSQGWYGVWAADSPANRLIATRTVDGGWSLTGIKPFCSGATFLQAALVTAHSDAGVLLFDIALDDARIRPQPSAWANAGLADTATVAVEFDAVPVSAARVLGVTGWYLTRPGFWHGAVGPAACWAGGALALIEAAAALRRKDPHSRAQVGALLAVAWALQAYLERAGREIDADPRDDAGQARIRALKVRHLIERACTEVLDRFGRATGPQLLAHDSQIARQYAALTVYIRQSHAERDLETIPA